MDFEEDSEEEAGPSTPKKSLGLSKDNSKHRQQKFRVQWRSDDRFKGWLEPDVNPFKAKCRVCNISFTAELSVLKSHGKGLKHNQLLKSVVRGQPKITALGFVKNNNPINKKVQTAEIKLAGFFAEHNLSFNTADHLIDIIKETLTEPEVVKKLSLKRTKCSSVVKNVIGNAFKEELVEELKTSRFSLLIDESTDIACVKSMCIVIRFFDSSSGRVVSRFFELVNIFGSDFPENIDQGATAENLYNVLMKVFEKNSIPKKNIIGFASDGCNTMMGENNSVSSRMKVDFPGIVILKCVCHSLHLCASEACKELPRELEDLVRGVFNFVHGSSKRMAIFEQFQKFLDIDVHKLLHPSQTRWLSVIAAVNRVVEQWDALKLFFTDMWLSEKTTQAEQIYQWLHDPFIKMYLLFLQYILPRFTELNEYFQSSRVVITNLHTKVKEVFRDILLTYMKRDYVLRNLDSVCGIDPEKDQFWISNKELYLGVDIFLELQKKEIFDQKEQLETFLNTCRRFLVRGCLEILKRYDFSDPVLSKLSFLRQKEALSNDFRRTHPTIMPLVLALPRIFDDPTVYQELDNEWRKLGTLRDELPTEITELSGDDTFWNNLLNYKNILEEQEFKYLPKYALEVLCLPHANADCERVFSKVNNIKTKSRNKLLTQSVNGVLLASEGIKSRGGCTSFQPEDNMFSKMTSSVLYKVKTTTGQNNENEALEEEEDVIFN